MRSKYVTIRTNPDTWEKLQILAGQIKRKRLDMINLALDQIAKMTKEEILKFLD